MKRRQLKELLRNAIYEKEETQLDNKKNKKLEIYQKLKEIKSNRYTAKDKEMVKEMLRELKKSCK